MNRVLRLALGLGVAILFIWLILRSTDIPGLLESLRRADVIYVSAAAIVFFIGYSCRIERWRLMLVQENPSIRWADCAGPLMASVAANNVLPFRAGDILRVVKFNRQLRISPATSIATLLVERLLDLLMMVSFLGVALACFGMDSSRLIGVGAGALLLAGMAILFLVIFPSVFHPLASWFARVVSLVHLEIGQKLSAAFHRIFAALEYTSRGLTMARLIFWSVLAWLLEGCVFWLVALSIPTISNDLAAWLALPIGTLATAIPSTPGYIGTFDYFSGQAMTALGNGSEGSMAFAFMVHAVLWLPPTVVGGLYLLMNSVSATKLPQRSQDESSPSD